MALPSTSLFFAVLHAPFLSRRFNEKTSNDTCLPSPMRTILLCAQAGSPKGMTLGGYAQLWYQYEDATNSEQQSYSHDLGAQEASGFNLYRARLSADAHWEGSGFRFQMKLEGGTPSLLDAYGYWRALGGILELDVGQMKIPSERETAESDDSLDFATRSPLRNTGWRL